MLKFIKYQFFRSFGLHLIFIYFCILLPKILSQDNTIWLFFWYLVIFLFEAFSLFKFGKDKFYTSKDVVKELEKLTIDNTFLIQDLAKIKEVLKNIDQGQNRILEALKNKKL